MRKMEQRRRGSALGAGTFRKTKSRAYDSSKFECVAVFIKLKILLKELLIKKVILNTGEVLRRNVNVHKDLG